MPMEEKSCPECGAMTTYRLMVMKVTVQSLRGPRTGERGNYLKCNNCGATMPIKWEPLRKELE